MYGKIPFKPVNFLLYQNSLPKTIQIFLEKAKAPYSGTPRKKNNENAPILAILGE